MTTTLPLAADSLGLGFTLLLLLGIIGWAGLLHFFFEPYVKSRRKRREAEAERLELESPLASLADAQRHRANRAVLAQRDRWSRSA